MAAREASFASRSFDFELSVKAGPLDPQWEDRLKEEYGALIQYMKQAREEGTDWFRLKATDSTGTRWEGVCWTFNQFKKYEYQFHITIPSSYPNAPPDIFVPALEGRTPKIYVGGRICLDIHFQPLWIQRVPYLGIVHALTKGLAPWLAAEMTLFS